jgi:hypothetical protein
MRCALGRRRIEDDVKLLRLDGRPQLVRWAVYLLLANRCGSLLLGLARASVHRGSTTLGMLIVVVFVWLVEVCVVLAIAYARRWALNLYVLFFVWAVVSVPIELSVRPRLGFPIRVWYGGSLIVDAVGIALLLLPESRRWFAACNAAQRGRRSAL